MVDTVSGVSEHLQLSFKSVLSLLLRLGNAYGSILSVALGKRQADPRGLTG